MAGVPGAVAGGVLGVVRSPAEVVGTVGVVGAGTESTVTVGWSAGGTRTFDPSPGSVAANAALASSTTAAVPIATKPA